MPKKKSFREQLNNEWMSFQKATGEFKEETVGTVLGMKAFIRKYPFLAVSFGFLLGYFLGSLRRK